MAVASHDAQPMTLDFEALFREHHASIRNYIHKRTSNPVLADHLAADVFARAFEAYQQGKGAHSHVSGWLYRIAHNVIIDHYRQRDRAKLIHLDDVAHTIYGPPAHKMAEATLQREAIHRSMAILTDDQRTVIELQLEGYAFGEIAAIMGKSEGAVKALRHRAIWAMRGPLSYLLGDGGQAEGIAA